MAMTATTRRRARPHSFSSCEDHTFWLPVIEHLDAAVCVANCCRALRADKPPGPSSVELFAQTLAA